MSRICYDRLQVGSLEENCYILYRDDRQDALVVDPGAEQEKITGYLALIHKTPAAAVLTHGHFDHTGALDAFEGIPIYISRQDAEMLTDPMKSAGADFGDLHLRPKATDFLWEGRRLELAGIPMEILHTPGHTPGSVCILADEDVLLTGDTLFCRGYGRTDLYGGDSIALYSSLRRILSLPDYRVLPGHGEETTISRERKGQW